MDTWLRRWITAGVGVGIWTALYAIHRNLQELRKEMSESLQAFQDALNTMNAETTRIGDYVLMLVAQSQRKDLTAEEEAALLAGYQAVGARLKAIGASPTEPVPSDAPLLPEVASTEAV